MGKFTRENCFVVLERVGSQFSPDHLGVLENVLRGKDIAVLVLW